MLDGKHVKTIEYHMTDFMRYCTQLYADLIDQIAPGSSGLIVPAQLPTDSSGGGYSPAVKYGHRWEPVPRPHGMPAYPR